MIPDVAVHQHHCRLLRVVVHLAYQTLKALAHVRQIERVGVCHIIHAVFNLAGQQREGRVGVCHIIHTFEPSAGQHCWQQSSRGRAGEDSRGKAGCCDRAGQQPLGHDRSAGAGQGRAGPQRHDRAGGSHG